MRVRDLVVVSVAVGTLVACGGAQRPPPGGAGCLEGMVRIEREAGGTAYCIDRYEASLVELTSNGERDFSPFETVNGRTVRAVSRPGVIPQAYVSRIEAEAACRRSQKRLCTESEWVLACAGKNQSTYPYGSERVAGACNDRGKAPLVHLASSLAAASNEWDRMNDPRLNQMSGTVAKTGSFARCESASGVFDMVGNLHEWVADREGTFLGGYYLDTKLNGPGCRYKTVAHGETYHDYSTGFRCCSSVAGP